MPEDGDCDESDDGDQEDADALIATSIRHAPERRERHRLVNALSH
jgi:hypothetical protein|nr:hypothetical protein [Neorhizobium tomejilense]